MVAVQAGNVILTTDNPDCCEVVGLTDDLDEVFDVSEEAVDEPESIDRCESET